MTRRGKAFIAGAYEHPRREIPDRTRAADPRRGRAGALADAGLTLADVDAYYCAGDAPGLRCRSRWPSTSACAAARTTRPRPAARRTSSTSATRPRRSPPATSHVALDHARRAPRTRRRAARRRWRRSRRRRRASSRTCGARRCVGHYALAARRHMYEFGTTSAQLAEIKVAASLHAQHNPHAFLRDVVTVEEVLGSPLVADPLHRLDCCVITDGGGALVVVSPEVAASLTGRCVKVLGQGEAVKDTTGGRIDLTYTGAVWSGPRGVRGGRGDAGRHRLRVDLRQLHDHRADDARGPRLLRQGRGRRGSSWTAGSSPRTAGCRSTPTAAACATTTRPTAAG